MLSKKFYNYWLIIHFKSFLGAFNWIFAKIHWNLLILKCRYYFANISAMKAPIFMKFETWAPKVIMNYHNNFRKDLCINAPTQGQNVRMCDETRTRTFTPFVRAFMHVMVVNYYLRSLSFKFHKDRSFRCGDICKIISTFWIL